MKALAVVLAALAVPAAAAVLGGSNLGVLGYPEPRCQRPIRPPDLLNLFARESYQSATNEYLECLEDYIESAENDIERIEEALDEAIDERDDFVRTL